MHHACRSRRALPGRAAVWLVASYIWSCSGGGSDPPPPPTPLNITVSSLPNGQVGKAYSAQLSAGGGTAPLSWALTSGTLPTGITLSSTTGALAGTPTTTSAGTALTFTVSDSATPPQSRSTTLHLNVSPASITVTVTPRRGAITVSQTLALSVSSNDLAGVSWNVAPAGCGSVSPLSTPGSGLVVFTPPATAAACTVTATSLTEASQSAAVTIGITDLAGVYTYHNDQARDGANTHEYALTPANVSTATFGKLFSCTVDGAIYAQPLWVANLAIGGGRHNVVFVATQHDSLYAFDADTSPCTKYWSVSLIDAAHGAPAAETSVPSGFANSPIGQGVGGDIAPEVGVTGTPVIDPAASILYVVSKSIGSGTSNIYQRLHAIDLASGNERSGSPVTLQASYPTNGSPITFNAGPENQRAGLVLSNGRVSIAFASHDDQPVWYGWVLSYTYGGSGFGTPAVLNVAPNAGQSGIWMSGGAPAVDNDGNLYLITGNGTLDATSATSPNNDYGDSFLQLNPNGGTGLLITSWFAPSDESADDLNNADFGSGGSAIVLNLSSGTLRHLVVGGGKDGVLYLLNGDSMGNLGDANARQYFNVGGAIFSTGAFWNNTLYQGVVGGPLRAYQFDPNMSMFNTAAVSQSANSYSFPGPTPSISAGGSNSGGILWSLDNSNYCTPSNYGTTPCGPAVLHAHDAAGLAHELWNSTNAAGDAAGFAVKFTVPTIANGKVYVGTRGNDSFNGKQPTIPGELDVYGLKP
jgi:hypothetical protein